MMLSEIRNDVSNYRRVGRPVVVKQPVDGPRNDIGRNVRQDYAWHDGLNRVMHACMPHHAYIEHSGCHEQQKKT